MFLLFGSRRCYYASGGWNDFLGVFKGDYPVDKPRLDSWPAVL